MSSVEKAYETQLSNIQKKTGKSLVELAALVKDSGLIKHGELRQMLMNELGLGFGDASTLVHYVQQTDGEHAAKAQGLSMQQILDGIYTGAKAVQRPIHDCLMAAIEQFGEFEIAPKKGYVSLRRKRQFAMLGPATNTRFEVGLNIKNLPIHKRLLEQPSGSMCNYKVQLYDVNEVNEELIAWIRQAYEYAG